MAFAEIAVRYCRRIPWSDNESPASRNKIRHTNIPLQVPPVELLPQRMPNALSCIYSVFAEGY